MILLKPRESPKWPGKGFTPTVRKRHYRSKLETDDYRRRTRLACRAIRDGQIPLQRCWAHKTRNVLNHVKDKDHAAVKKSLHQITHAPNLFSARQGAKAFKQKWEDPYPNAVKCLLKD